MTCLILISSPTSLFDALTLFFRWRDNDCSADEKSYQARLTYKVILNRKWEDFLEFFSPVSHHGRNLWLRRIVDVRQRLEWNKKHPSISKFPHLINVRSLLGWWKPHTKHYFYWTFLCTRVAVKIILPLQHPYYLKAIFCLTSTIMLL